MMLMLSTEIVPSKTITVQYFCERDYIEGKGIQSDSYQSVCSFGHLCGSSRVYIYYYLLVNIMVVKQCHAIYQRTVVSMMYHGTIV